MMRNLLYLLCLGIYLLRWLLFGIYGLLQFLAKPGSRLIVPVLAMGAAWYWRTPLDGFIAGCLVETDWRHLSTTIYVLTGLAAMGTCATLIASSYSIGRGLSFVGRILRFAFKLSLVAGLVLGVAYYYRLPLGFDVSRYVPRLDRFEVTAVTILNTVLALAVLVAISIYMSVSRLLTLLIGAFPPVIRPLRPLRSLKTRNRAIRSVVVRRVVPKLPKRRAGHFIDTAQVLQ